LQKAKDYAFLLLKFRLRSEKEFVFRLKKKKFDEKTIKQALAFLKKEGLLDETYKHSREEDVVLKLAKERFEELKDIEPLKAKRRIFSYFLRRGFSPEIINEAIGQL